MQDGLAQTWSDLRALTGATRGLTDAANINYDLVGNFLKETRLDIMDRIELGNQVSEADFASFVFLKKYVSPDGKPIKFVDNSGNIYFYGSEDKVTELLRTGVAK